MHLDLVPARPGGAERPPLLFVHGAWHGAWCWADHFLPHVAARGFDAYALDLRGHGRAPLEGPLNRVTLRDYVADVAEAVARIGRPPVLIGHSMGALLVQRHLAAGGRGVAAVLLTPVPLCGVRRLTLRFARRHPRPFLRANLLLRLREVVATPALAREALLRDSCSDAEARALCERLQDESYLAYLGMMAPRIDPRRVTVPVLVVAAGADRLFSVDEVEATARAYGVTAERIPGAAHDLMLDPAWPSVADRIVAWIEALPGVPRAAAG